MVHNDEHTNEGTKCGLNEDIKCTCTCGAIYILSIYVYIFFFKLFRKNFLWQKTEEDMEIYVYQRQQNPKRNIHTTE